MPHLVCNSAVDDPQMCWYRVVCLKPYASLQLTVYPSARHLCHFRANMTDEQASSAPVQARRSTGKRDTPHPDEPGCPSHVQAPTACDSQDASTADERRPAKRAQLSCSECEAAPSIEGPNSAVNSAAADAGGRRLPADTAPAADSAVATAAAAPQAAPAAPRARCSILARRDDGSPLSSALGVSSSPQWPRAYAPVEFYEDYWCCQKHSKSKWQRDRGVFDFCAYRVCCLLHRRSSSALRSVVPG